MTHRQAQAPPTAAQPTPLQDDAALNDVQLVGSHSGWAVGAQGSIWHTADGGASWALQDSSTEANLTSVCFLTDRVGWIAGNAVQPYASIPYGVVLFTEDGGGTWQVFGRESLPQLHFIRFFDLERGVAAGQSNSAAPTGVFTTSDGGRTWTPLPGPAGAGWRAASFPSDDPLVGVLTGEREQIALVGGDRVLPPRGLRSGLRGIHDVQLNEDGTPKDGYGPEGQ